MSRGLHCCCHCVTCLCPHTAPSLPLFLWHSVDDFFALYDVSVVAPTGLRKRRTIVVDRLNRMVYRCASRKAARQLVNNSTLLADEAQAQEAALRAAALSSSGMVSSPDSASAETGKVGLWGGVREACPCLHFLSVCHMQQGKKRAKGKFVARKIDHDTTVLAHNTDLKRIKLLFEGAWVLHRLTLSSLCSPRKASPPCRQVQGLLLAWL